MNNMLQLIKIFNKTEYVYFFVILAHQNKKSKI